VDRETLSHYRILHKVGAGGMGEVFLAEDTRLKRKIAIKVLSTDTTEDSNRLARFKREAEMVAALNHPNIVTIHSVEEDEGVHFLTMEWVEGKTLGDLMAAGAMSLQRVFELAIPIADALAAAQDKGITHRDLKPANIMINDQGRVKILDFGLAKLYDQGEVGAGNEEPTQALTQEGLAVGTVPYMSPEQVRGDGVDHRTDIFSLGIILYEMVAGQRPFQGQSSADLVSSILRDTPSPVTDSNASLPHHLGRVIQRCLEKDPEKRYQTAKDVRNELEGLKGEVESGVARVSTTSMPTVPTSRSRKSSLPVAAAILGAVLVIALVWKWSRSSNEDTQGATESVAELGGESGGALASASDRLMTVVLPFDNLGLAEDAYFAAGVTDEISGRLAAVSGLGVISRKSAAQYADTDKTVQQIGEELGVDYIIDGTVRWAKQSDGTSRVRITPELIEVASDQQLWTDIYDREIDDIFEVQSEIAEQVIDALGVTVLGSEEEALEARPTQNVEAYQAYLRGKDFERNPTLAGNPFVASERAIESYERAVELDPGFLEAWSRLATLNARTYSGWDQSDERLERARNAVKEAESIGEDLPWTRLARGYYHYYGFREYDLALEEFVAAAESRPNDPEVLQAIGFIYRRQGRYQESLDQLEKTALLAPNDIDLLTTIAETFRATRQLDPTLEYYDRAIAVQPNSDQFYMVKAEVLTDLTGDVAASRAVLETMPDSNTLFSDLAWMFQAMRERDFQEASKIADTIEIGIPTFKVFLTGLRAWISFFAVGPEASRDKLEIARRAFEEAIDATPGNADLHSSLATVLSLLGDDTRALQEARLAVDLDAKDLFSGPVQLETLAQVYGRAGRTDEAIDLIERLLATDYSDSLTVHLLRLEPWWDPLRAEPRFQELIAE